MPRTKQKETSKKAVKEIKKKKKAREEEDDEGKEEMPWVSAHVKKSISGIVLIGLAIILLLAMFHQAGPAGETLFSFLYKGLGWGYYVLPLVALVVSGLFLTAAEMVVLGPSLAGAVVFTGALLSMIDVAFPDKAGLLGQALGMIEVPFGNVAAMVVGSVVLVSSALMTLNIPLKIQLPGKKAATIEEEPVVTGLPDEAEELSSGVQEKEKKEEVKKPEEKKEVEVKIAKDKMEAVPIDGPNVAPVALLHNYTPPPLNLLKATIEKPTAGDLKANANIIKRTLESFGINVEMGEINIGPKVTRYTLKPAEGVRLTRITALNSDLSLALAAHPIRIEAPIPGKSLVGIEVPNKTAAIVRLGSLISYPNFMKLGPLALLIGRDVNGEPIEANIEKMPHCLISGSTGSGKSILVHSFIISLLYKNSPETLRLIMIDPKKVELSVYNGIPHLAAPVVTDNKKSMNVFRWAVAEMDRRYETLMRAGTRDIGSYNKSAEEKLPYIVLIVDELADLMATSGREIEAAIVRLAQMARATGIHLVLATQRPSVEVITGLIKANITTRIALQTASQIDSRTILDSAGAEKLLGGGDMLFVSSTSPKPRRIQGAYISEDEIREVAEFIREHNQAAPETQVSITGAKEQMNAMGGEAIGAPTGRDVNFDDYGGGSEGSGDDDEMLDQALAVVYESKKASASLLQRRLKVGYARAARLLDIMEEKGAIGPGEGAKPREIYYDSPIYLKLDITAKLAEVGGNDSTDEE
ncbi:MAG: DNA translocase FtsK [Candidatus Harrisonbacteria bacterium]|nr:DNA translocase FtsK [Candidatus Harrisonbacteria bacterium]